MSFTFSSSSSSFSDIKRTLDTSTKNIAQAMERLSTGLRINDASDDAANLAISKTYETRVSALNTAIDNIAKAVNEYEVLDGTLVSIVSSFEDLREIAVNASNGTYTAAELQSFDDQAGLILESIEDMANETNDYLGTANTTLGAAYTYSTHNIQVGHDGTADSQIAVTGVGIGFASWSGINLTTQANAQAAITELDSMLDTLNTQRSGIGSEISILAEAAEMNANRILEYSSALSLIRDADVADETAELTKHQIIQQSSISVMAQLQDTEKSIAYTLLNSFL